VLYHLWPAFSLPNGLERAGLSRDPEVVRAYHHETHNEPERQQVIDFALDWLAKL